QHLSRVVQAWLFRHRVDSIVPCASTASVEEFWSLCTSFIRNRKGVVAAGSGSHNTWCHLPRILSGIGEANDAPFTVQFCSHRFEEIVHRRSLLWAMMCL